MLQWLYTYVASVCSKCFSYFSEACCKCVFQIFHLFQIYTHICCKRMFTMFHLVLDVCCSKCCSLRALTREHVRTPIVRCARNGRSVLVKVHARMQITGRQSGSAPSGHRNRRPCTTRHPGPPQCIMQRGQHKGTHIVLSLSLSHTAGPTHMLSRAGVAAGASRSSSSTRRAQQQHVGVCASVRTSGR